MVNENNLEEYKKKFLEIMNKNRNLDEELAIVITDITNVGFAYVIDWNSQEYLETGEINYFLLNTSPVVLTKVDGKFHYTSWRKSFDEELERIEDEYKTSN